MFNQIEKFKAKAGVLKAAAFLALFLLALYIINGEAVGVGRLVRMTGGAGILDLQNGYSVNRAYEILSGLGPAGRAYYLRAILPMDFIFPLTYTLFYLSTMLWILKATPALNKWMNLIVFVPLLTVLFDYAENIMIINMLVSFPQQLTLTAKAANVFTMLKFNFVSLNAAIIVAMAANCLIKKYFKSPDRR